MELTKEQENIYLELTSAGWEFIQNDGNDVIIARPIVVNDGPVGYKDYVRIEPDGRIWEITGKF